MGGPTLTWCMSVFPLGDVEWAFQDQSTSFKCEKQEGRACCTHPTSTSYLPPPPSHLPPASSHLSPPTSHLSPPASRPVQESYPNKGGKEICPKTMGWAGVPLTTSKCPATPVTDGGIAMFFLRKKDNPANKGGKETIVSGKILPGISQKYGVSRNLV